MMSIAPEVDRDVAGPPTDPGVCPPAHTAAPGKARVRERPAATGAAAAGAMLVFYAAVVVGASRSPAHLVDQVVSDWYLILPIAAGFGVQIALLVELRRRHRLPSHVAAAGASGAGTSTIGMLACCAHHVADLFPLVGATAAATFLYDYRLPFMLTGLGMSAAAIAVALRRLRQVPSVDEEVDHACASDRSSH